MKVKIPMRVSDSWGQGHYGAPRSGRTHNGVDMAAPTGAEVYPVVAGIVTKHGWVSSDSKKAHLRYIEVTDDNEQKHRYMYVEPIAKMGNYVDQQHIIGKVQDLQPTYPGITNHIHYEIKLQDGSYIDPTPFIEV